MKVMANKVKVMYTLLIVFSNVACFDTRLATKLKDIYDSRLKRTEENEMGVLPVNRLRLNTDGSTKATVIHLRKTVLAHKDFVLPAAPRPFIHTYKTTTDIPNSHPKPFNSPLFSPVLYKLTTTTKSPIHRRHTNVPKFRRKKTTKDYSVVQIRPRPFIVNEEIIRQYIQESKLMANLGAATMKTTTTKRTSLKTSETKPTTTRPSTTTTAQTTSHRRLNNTYVRKRIDLSRTKPKSKLRRIIIIPAVRNSSDSSQVSEENAQIYYGNLVDLEDKFPSEDVPDPIDSATELPSKCILDTEETNVNYICIPISPTVHYPNSNLNPNPKRRVIINKNRRELNRDEIHILNKSINKLTGKNIRKGIEISKKNVGLSEDDIVFVDDDKLHLMKNYHLKKRGSNDRRKSLTYRSGLKKGNTQDDRWELPEYMKYSRKRYNLRR